MDIAIVINEIKDRVAALRKGIDIDIGEKFPFDKCKRGYAALER